ncbi:hypothetical protein HDV05_004259 [Chytridiales sp. JEL 0842]|nr:hypothetical protein HDV05_004259 [Chytridiales sp. JEL 0842]
MDPLVVRHYASLPLACRKARLFLLALDEHLHRRRLLAEYEFLQGRHLRQNQWWPNRQTRKFQEFTKKTIDAFKNGLLPYTFIRGRDGDSLEHVSFGMGVKVKRNPHFNPNSGFTLVAAPDEGLSVLATVFVSSRDVFSCGPQVGHDLAKMQERCSFGQKVIANPFYNHAEDSEFAKLNGKGRLEMKLFLRSCTRRYSSKGTCSKKLSSGRRWDYLVRPIPLV